MSPAVLTRVSPGGACSAQATAADIPARLDRLPWCRFHLLVVAALGITWIVDGLEVTIVGSIAPALESHQTLAMTASEVGSVASAYVVGAVIGALVFGVLSDRLGRRSVFYATLSIYVVGVALSALAWNFWSFALFRAITGLGVGGEYSAINSAIDELMPKRLRGRIDLSVNGSYWIGAAIGAGASIALLDARMFGVDVGWRLGFAIGGVLGLCILGLRRWVPESPRWLIAHGREAQARAVVDGIEARLCQRGVVLASVPQSMPAIPAGGARDLSGVIRAMFGRYRSRSLLVLALMASQAFLFNAIFFTYGLVLRVFFHVPDDKIGLHILPLAAASFLGPVLLGPLFDTIGRRRMITATYVLSGVLLAATALLFRAGLLDGTTQTLAWSTVFFVASTAASSAYLTASEVFPMESRGLAIALFYAIGTGVGGVVAPWVLGSLIGTGSPAAVSGGYLAAAVLMVAAGAVEAMIGLDCECCSLEEITLSDIV